MGLNIVDSRAAWQGDGRADVIGRGNDLVNSIRSSRATGQHDTRPDTDIATGTAYLMWGIAAGSERDLAEGVSLFDKVARQIGPGGEPFFSLKDPDRFGVHVGREWLMSIDDKTIGDLVLAAHTARAAGIDLFNRKVGEATLYEAVIAWQEVLFGPETAVTQGQSGTF